MESQNIDHYLKNQSLKAEFARRNLDLAQVWLPSPDDIELENRQLRALLDWVEAFEQYGGNRRKMEAKGYDFPPLSFDFGPDEDWLRFRRWLAGQTVRGKLKTRLSADFIKDPDKLTDEQIIQEMERLEAELERLHCSVDLKAGLPPRLVYNHLLEVMAEDMDFLMTGCWHLDGCSGYCPDCFQRPWCKAGTSSCWQEDEEAGYMVFPDAAKRYVSPSSVSLAILRICQDEENAMSNKFQDEKDIF